MKNFPFPSSGEGQGRRLPLNFICQWGAVGSYPTEGICQSICLKWWQHYTNGSRFRCNCSITDGEDYFSIRIHGVIRKGDKTSPGGSCLLGIWWWQDGKSIHFDDKECLTYPRDECLPNSSNYDEDDRNRSGRAPKISLQESLVGELFYILSWCTI